MTSRANRLGTILTFFPRRWGRNNSDTSGIFEGICSRLEYLRPGEVRSAFDLALIIMNECSTFYSNRSKPSDERPQLLDIFANAVVRVVSTHTMILDTADIFQVPFERGFVRGFLGTSRPYKFR